MTVLARNLEAEPITYAIKVEPRFVTVLEGMAANDGCTVEELIATWVELSCVELNMGRPVPFSDDDIDAIEEGIAQLRRGEYVRQEDLMERLKAKYGG